MNFRIDITLKPEVLDPQGKAIENSLKNNGFTEVKNVRVGKVITLSINALNEDEAYKKIQKMCTNILANTVIENFKFSSNKEN